MGLDRNCNGKVLSSFSVFLFLTILLMVVARRISTSVLLFSVQSAIIAAEGSRHSITGKDWPQLMWLAY